MAAWDDYDLPGAPGAQPAARSADELRRIVRYQRWLIGVVLAQLALWGGFVLLGALSRGGFADEPRFAVLLTFILGAVGAIYVFLLCWELKRGGVVAFMLGAATFVPCMGLLVLTLVHGYATTELRKHGVKVGPFGASLAAVDERRSLYDDEDEDAGW